MLTISYRLPAKRFSLFFKKWPIYDLWSMTIGHFTLCHSCAQVDCIAHCDVSKFWMLGLYQHNNHQIGALKSVTFMFDFKILDPETISFDNVNSAMEPRNGIRQVLCPSSNAYRRSGYQFVLILEFNKVQSAFSHTVNSHLVRVPGNHFLAHPMVSVSFQTHAETYPETNNLFWCQKVQMSVLIEIHGQRFRSLGHHVN